MLQARVPSETPKAANDIASATAPVISAVKERTPTAAWVTAELIWALAFHGTA